MKPFALPPLRILSAMVLCALATAPDVRAAHSFRVQLAGAEITRTVDRFDIEAFADGYVVLKLVPFIERKFIDQSILQLGRKTAIGEQPISGEATWLATVESTGRVVVKLPSADAQSQLAVGTVVLSVSSDPNPVDPVAGALEAAGALAKLNFKSDAVTLLSGLAAEPRYSASRCQILQSLLLLQTPDAPTAAEPLPPDAEKSLRALLASCDAAQAETASRVLARWTLQRINFLRQHPDPAYPDLVALARDAYQLVQSRPGGDELLLLIAQLHHDNGFADDGSKVIEELLRTYPSSTLMPEARTLQQALARRAPASGYKPLGPVGPADLLGTLQLESLTDLAFDTRGDLLLLDADSKPRQLLLATLDVDKRAFNVTQTIYLSRDWYPVSVGRDTSGLIFLLDDAGNQLIKLDPSTDPPGQLMFPNRGEEWKLRKPARVAIVANSEALVFDPSSRAIHGYSFEGGHRSLIYLNSKDYADAVDIAVAPDGQALVATPGAFSLFTPDEGPKQLIPALRGRSATLRVGRIAADRWHYVYLFDTAEQRIEKFRRNGEWLTTVVDCSRANIKDPRLWAVSPEGDVVVYDRAARQLHLFTQ